MSASLKFIKGEPPLRHSPQGQAMRYAAVKAALRERPGVWAEVVNADGAWSSRSTAANLGTRWRAEGFEVRIGHDANGSRRVYARWPK